MPVRFLWRALVNCVPASSVGVVPAGSVGVRRGRAPCLLVRRVLAGRVLAGSVLAGSVVLRCVRIRLDAGLCGAVFEAVSNAASDSISTAISAGISTCGGNGFAAVRGRSRHAPEASAAA